MALVSAFASVVAQMAVLGGLVSILAGLFHSFMQQDEERERNRNQILERLSVPLALVSHQDLYDQYLAICQALNELAQNGDPILREMACLKLASVTNQIASLAAGTVVFSGTEALRTVYDQILKSPDVKHYRSVAWVRSPDYWQDPPGRQSMQANFTAAHRGVLIERAIILHDPLWPRGDLLPRKAILPWIEEQHNQGLWLTFAARAIWLLNRNSCATREFTVTEPSAFRNWTSTLARSVSPSRSMPRTSAWHTTAGKDWGFTRFLFENSWTNYKAIHRIKIGS